MRSRIFITLMGSFCAGGGMGMQVQRQEKVKVLLRICVCVCVCVCVSACAVWMREKQCVLSSGGKKWHECYGKRGRKKGRKEYGKIEVMGCKKRKGKKTV